MHPVTGPHPLPPLPPWRRVARHRLWTQLNLTIACALLVLSLAAYASIRADKDDTVRVDLAPLDARKLGLPALPDAIESAVESGSGTMPPDEAREINASIPYVTAPGPSALPFHFAGSAEDHARARLCLAAAALYEAGSGDAVGQKAVMQVVINRARHPAFIPSICGVVFQGSERKTGCQFTFTCDGALSHRYSARQWQDASERAEAMLNGEVYAPVGLATHYHTDWVHPYWSTSLDKLTKVGTHLFFRWRGFWGTRPAFARRLSGAEPRIYQLAAFDVHGGLPGTDGQGALMAMLDGNGADNSALSADLIAQPPDRQPIDPKRLNVAPALAAGSQILVAHPDGGGYLIAVSPDIGKERFGKLAEALCGFDQVCRVQAWRDPGAVPAGFPIGIAARKSIAFEYFRDMKEGTQYTFGG